MPPIKVNGIIIRKVNYKDYDCILTLFTLEHGLMTVSARGVRRQNAKYRSSCELFSVSSFDLFNRSNKYYLSQSEVTQGNFELRNDPIIMMHATFCANLIEASIIEDQSNEKLYSLFLKTLACFCHLHIDPKVTTCYFIVNAMQLIGYDVNLSNCTICTSNRLSSFSITAGGMLCSNCSRLHIDSIPMVELDYKALRFLRSVKIDDLNKTNVYKESYKRLLPILIDYCHYHLDKVFKSSVLLTKFSSK